ncbi:hypothetical protein SCA6_000326 [Theobroma cacao]
MELVGTGKLPCLLGSGFPYIVTPWSQHHPCLSTGITMLNRGRERRGVGWLRLVAPAAAT